MGPRDSVPPKMILVHFLAVCLIWSECWSCVCAGAKDERKLDYALDAVRGPSPFVNDVVLEVAVDEALEWQASKTAEQVMDERENMICALERADKLMRESGAVSDWFDGCDKDIAKVRWLIVVPVCQWTVQFVRSATA
jgi:hypothetical protein